MINGKKIMFLVLSLALPLIMLVMVPWTLAGPGERPLAYLLATTRYVAADGDCDGMLPCYDMIQTAVDAAADGDTILIESGTYTENLSVSTNLTIQGADAATTVVSGALTDTVLLVANNTAVSVTQITLAHGQGDCVGGGLENFGVVRLTDAIIRDNVTSCGGAGISNMGSVHIRDSLIEQNISSLGGGGIRNWEAGVLTLNNSTVRNNTDLGIYNEGSASIDGSTIHGNTRGFSILLNGKGVYNDGGVLTLSNSTLSNNNLAVESGTVTATNSTLNDQIIYFDGSIWLQNSIAIDCSRWVSGTGSVQSLGHNLGRNATCNLTAVGDRQNRDPKLAPLQDNGGPTLTHALLWASPARDAGNDAVCQAAPISGLDQRGVARPQYTACDIGAYEFDRVVVLDNRVFLPVISTP